MDFPRPCGSELSGELPRPPQRPHREIKTAVAYLTVICMLNEAKKRAKVGGYHEARVVRHSRAGGNPSCLRAPWNSCFPNRAFAGITEVGVLLSPQSPGARQSRGEFRQFLPRACYGVCGSSERVIAVRLFRLTQASACSSSTPAIRCSRACRRSRRWTSSRCGNCRRRVRAVPLSRPPPCRYRCRVPVRFRLHPRR